MLCILLTLETFNIQIIPALLFIYIVYIINSEGSAAAIEEVFGFWEEVFGFWIKFTSPPYYLYSGILVKKILNTFENLPEERLAKGIF